MNEKPTREIELTEDHYDFLFKAGASPEFMEVVRKTDDELSDIIERNTVRMEAKRYVKWNMLNGSPDEFVPDGGHFFQTLWRGNLYSAFGYADPNNRKILLLTFGERRINEDRPNVASPTVARLEGRA
jgi:hypothetical protein